MEGSALSPLLFEGLIAQLRRLGFEVGIDKQLRLEKLLSQVCGECSPEDLKSILCPLFAVNKEQQEAFYSAFDSFFAVLSLKPQQAETPELLPGQRNRQGSSRHPSAPRRWPYFLTAATLLIILIGIAEWKTHIGLPTTHSSDTVIPLAPSAADLPPPEIALRKDIDERLPPQAAFTPPELVNPPHPPPSSGAPPIARHSVFETVRRLIARFPFDVAPVIVILGPILFFLANEWYRWRRRRLILQKRAGRRPPYSWPIRVKRGAGSIYNSPEFSSAASRLHSREAVASRQVDLERSVQATAKSLGYLSLAYRPDARFSEYLLLIDRVSVHDHQAALFKELSDALHRQGVYVEQYFFDQDPRICWKPESSAPVRLQDLQNKYRKYRLFLFGDADRLTHPVTGRLEAWARGFSAWSDRAIFTPLPLLFWGVRERTLAEQFMVLPATTESLISLVGIFDGSPRSEIRHGAADVALEMDVGAAPSESVDRLRRTLGLDVFTWLCALAVYPELQWDLTLYLASLPCMPENLITEANLLRLIALPWFRNGSIPDEMRFELIQQLSPDRERGVRQAVLELLERNPAAEETFAFETQTVQIAVNRAVLKKLNPRAVTSRFARKHLAKDVVKDHVILRSAESFQDSPLDLLLPARFRNIFRVGGLSVLALRASGVCLLFALFVALSYFFTISYLKNRNLENQVSEAAKPIGSVQVAGTDVALLGSLQRLDTLRRSVQTLSDWHRTHPPLMYRFLYIGDDLYPEARRLYFARFKQLLFAQTQGNDLAYLRGLPATPGPDYQPTYNALKAYLITTSNHDKSAKEFLTPELMYLWQNGRKADADGAQLARSQFDFYADELKVENPYTNANDSAAVEKARRYLANMGGAQSVYAFMLAEASKANPPVNFNRMFPGSAQIVVDTHVVAGAFSKRGWAFMKDAIAHPDTFRGGEKWVVGDYMIANFDPAKLSEAIRSFYYADFIKEWTQYLKSASVVGYRDPKDAAEKLQKLSGNQSPLLELFSLAANNTDVDDATVKDKFQPVQAVTKPGNMQKFVGPENQYYVKALIALQTAMDASANTPGATSDQAAPVENSAQQAIGQVRQMAGAFNPDRTNHIDNMSANLLLQPITFAQRMIVGADAAALNSAGKGLCAQEKPIMDKFPFKSNATAQATMDDFNAIFDPKKGLLWTFYDAKLQKLVQKNGWQFTPASTGGTNVSPAFLSLLNRAGAFTAVAYANGAGPQFKYTVKPQLSPELDSIKMTIDGQAVEFTQANQALKQFSWPGTGHGVQASVSYRGLASPFPPYDGLWGIFQFVHDADVHQGARVDRFLKPGKGENKVLDPVTKQPITLTFDITANPPVFEKGYFAGLACVADVAR